MINTGDFGHLDKLTQGLNQRTLRRSLRESVRRLGAEKKSMTLDTVVKKLVDFKAEPASAEKLLQVQRH